VSRVEGSKCPAFNIGECKKYEQSSQENGGKEGEKLVKEVEHLWFFNKVEKYEHPVNDECNDNTNDHKKHKKWYNNLGMSKNTGK
jgi:hypothetical protein